MRTLRRPELFAALQPALLLAIAGCLARTPPLDAQQSADGAVHGVVHVEAFRFGPSRPTSPSVVTLDSLDGGDALSRTAFVQPDGSFVLPHLAPGEYLLSLTPASGDSSTDSSTAFHSAQLLTILAGETLELDAILDPYRGPADSLTLQVLQPANAGNDDALPDENADGLSSTQGLAAIQSRASFDGIDTNQRYGSVPVGAGSDPAPDPDGDSDSADLTTGPAHGLSRGRRAGAPYAFSRGAVREFHIDTRGYSTQSADSGGSSTLSRPGSRELHGSAVFTLRSQMLAARTPFAVATAYLNGVVTSAATKPHDLRENFGVTLGGPVPGLRSLVFLYNFDLQRRGFPAISSPADPNFYNLTATQRALLGNRGLNARQIDAGLNFVSSLTGPTDRRADQTLHFARLDWRAREHAASGPGIGRGMVVGLEYNRVRWTSPAGLIDAPTVARARSSIGDSAGSLDTAIARLTTVFSPHLLNQAHIAFLRDLQFETPQHPLAQEPAIGPGGLAPEVNIGPNGLLLGTPANLSRRAYPDERRLQFGDTLTLVRGRHLIEVGGDLSLTRERVASLANAAGTFRSDSGLTKGYAGGLVDFLTDYTFNVNSIPNGGCPSISAPTHLFCFRSFTQSFGGASVDFSTQDWSAFAEDTWRPRHNLSLHAGLRYEYTLLPFPASPNPALDAIFAARGATSIFPEDRNNLGPRASVAYQPFGPGGGLIRLGFGLFFGRVPGATIRAALSDTAQPATTTKIRITPATITACPQVPAQGFGYPCDFTAQPPGAVAATSSAVVFDRHFRLPVIQQGSVSFERSLGRSATVSATYVMNLDRQLPSSTDLNIAPSTAFGRFQLQGGTGAPGVRSGEAFSLPIYTARVSPGFGPVTDIVSNGNATYNGLLLAADAHPWHSIRLRLNSTWSKAIDFDQTQSAIPRTNGQLDPFTNGYDKGLSSLNYPWSVHLNAVWMPRLPDRVPTRLRTLADGWELAPIVTARAGRPYSFDLSGGTRLPGGHQSINGSGGALYLPTIGRNTLRLPATVHVDLRLARSFRPTPRLRTLLSLESFNLLNHRNLSSVNQRAFLIGSPAFGVTPLVFQDAAAIAAEGLNTQPFGTPTAASTSVARERQLQLSLHLQF